MKFYATAAAERCSWDVVYSKQSRLVLGIVVVLALQLGGCTGGRVIVFATGTVIGVEATVEEAQQHFLVGVKRFEGAVVPAVHTAGGLQGTARGQAYSVFAVLGFRTGLSQPTRILQIFATGEAANTMAGSSSAASNITKAAKGIEAEYSTDPAAKFFRKKIREHIDVQTSDPANPGTTIGDTNWLALTAYLNSVGVQDSIALWLYSASSGELEAAVTKLQWD